MIYPARRHRPSPALVLFLALALALLLTACSGDGDEPSTSPTPSMPTAVPSPASCPLISPEEAEAVLELPPGQPSFTTVGNTISCAYQPGPDRGLLVGVTSGVTKEDFERQIAEGAEFLGREAQPVPGVGDEAFWLEPYILFLKGTRYFQVSVWRPGLSGEGQMEIARDLAAKAAERAP